MKINPKLSLIPHFLLGLFLFWAAWNMGWVENASASNLLAAQLLEMPYKEVQENGGLALLQQDYEQLEINQSILKTPLKVGEQIYDNGLGTHSISRIRVYLPDQATGFQAWVGVDNNPATTHGMGSVVFVVKTVEQELFRSEILRGGGKAVRIDIKLPHSKYVDLIVENGGDGPACDHADWADAKLILEKGDIMHLAQLPMLKATSFESAYPFSFSYDGKSSDQLLAGWKKASTIKELDEDRTQHLITWTEPGGGMRVIWEAIQYNDFPAMEWVVSFEGAGKRDTALVENIQAMNLTISEPMDPQTPYRLHQMSGTLFGNGHDMFVPSEVTLGKNTTNVRLHSDGGASSATNFPFYRVQTGQGDLMVGIGWTCSWESQLTCADGLNLNLTAGMQKTHFLLHPGEKVRMPRILVLKADAEQGDARSLFRRLIYTHYVPDREKKPILPPVYCNTCFTEGGGWLGDANNEANQASLIHAYGKLGADLVITDAGWMEGEKSYLARLGNWQAMRKDNYPLGIAPLASAAHEEGIQYGLWMAIEFVAEGTWIYKNHPEWLIDYNVIGIENRKYCLLNLGLPEVQDWIFETVKSYMDHPGFGVFRIDWGGLGVDPFEFCAREDAPDRQGITEIQFVTGLYNILERIHQAFPFAWLEGCASGGNRIDIETIRHFHMHQKSDYWFDHEYDQACQWAFNQFLPGNCIAMHLRNMDDYSFHSIVGGSMSLGWKADDPQFDSARGKELIEKYKSVRHLTLGDWYPLLPYAAAGKHDQWMASQYDRPELGEGMLVVLRRPTSAYKTIEVKLKGLTPDAMYELSYDTSGETRQVDGRTLMNGFDITLPTPRSSELIRYRLVK